MNEPAFSASIAAALDRYAVPPLAAGFTDRLLARLEAGNLPVDALHPAVPPRAGQSRRRLRPWQRPGRILGAVTAVSLLTATAAASGLLGDRVYIPVVSDILVGANIVEEAEKPAPVAAKPKLPTAKADPVVAPLPPLKGSEAVRDMWSRLRADPAFLSLPQPEKAERIKAENRALIASGQVTPADIRAARIERTAEQRQKAAILRAPVKQKAEEWRERYDQASPEEQAAMREEVRRKREARLARRRGEIVTDEEPVLSPIENKVR